MSEIRIYVEGGGDQKRTKKRLRKGFDSFLESIKDRAREKRIKWQVVACGGRNYAYKDFKKGLKTHPDAFNILLVDSEGPVNSPPWQHVEWDACSGNDSCQLMVQTMEAWLIADRENLISFYGDKFNQNAIPDRRDVETIDKNTLKNSLSRATAGTQKGEYHKTQHGFDLLGTSNPDIVRNRARHCRMLFETIAGYIDSQ